MKNKIKDYVGLSEEDKRYLREFDKAVENGFFKDDLVKIPKKMKNEIETERNKFKEDLMYKGKRITGDVSDMVIKEKVALGKKRRNQKRDENGKFVKEKSSENSRDK